LPRAPGRCVRLRGACGRRPSRNLTRPGRTGGPEVPGMCCPLRRQRSRTTSASIPSAQSHLDAILHALRGGQDELPRTTPRSTSRRVVVGGDGPLNQYVYIAERLDARLSAGIADLEATDPERARSLRDDVLFYDAPEAPGPPWCSSRCPPELLGIDVIIKEQPGAVKGVDAQRRPRSRRCAPRWSWLRPSANQKLSSDQITAAQHDDVEPDRAHLADAQDNSVRIQSRRRRRPSGLPQLQAAFANIYATMDASTRSKAGALDNHGRHDRDPGDRGPQVP